MVPTWEFLRNMHHASTKTRPSGVFSFTGVTHMLILKGMLKLPTVMFLVALIVLATIHLIALNFFLYWHFFWLDIFVHGFAGAIVALGIFTVADFWPRFSHRWLNFIPVVTVVLVVGLAWEVFEIWNGIMIEDNFLIDFTIDLIMDIFGGTIGFLVGRAVRQI